MSLAKNPAMSVAKKFAKMLPALLLLFLGCGKTTEVAATSCGLTANFCSCDERAATSKSCVDYEGYKPDSAQSECKGTFSTTSACPTATRVGTCRVGLTVGSDKYYRRYYSSDYANAAAGAVACNSVKISLTLIANVDWLAD